MIISDVSFPKDFRQICKKILTRLFRVFVHVYIHHFDRIRELGTEPHANTLYKHFYFFVTEYGMVSTKELEALVSYANLEHTLKKKEKSFTKNKKRYVQIII